MIIEFEGIKPKIHKSVFIADGVQIIGDVEIAENASIWYNTVIRGDVHYIRIGKNTNVQDLSMIHVTNKKFPTIIGDNVSIGHSVSLHGCMIHDNCLVGIGSIILDDAEIASNCLIAAGSLVVPRFKSEENTLIMGNPAKTVRKLRDSELEMIQRTAANYLKYVQRYREQK